MHKILAFAYSIFIFSAAKCQSFEQRPHMNEVDSIISSYKLSKNDTAVIYYVDAATNYGIILLQIESKKSGIVFHRTNKEFKHGSISKLTIDNSRIFNQFIDSVDALKRSQPFGEYRMSHDFDLNWIYIINTKADTICKKMSDIVGGGDHIAQSMFAKFEKFYDLTAHLLKSRPRSKKNDLKDRRN